MKLSLASTLGSALVLALAASVGDAAIERLDLQKMMTRADGAVSGVIVDREVFRVDHPEDGTMYFTTITVDGTSLVTGKKVQVPVTYLGGYISETEGAFVSEMPKDSMTTPGREVVVFYKWLDNMGYGVAANAMYAAHGGVYSVVKKGSKSVVLGRGDGYAISANDTLPNLRQRVAQAAQQKSK